MRKLRKEFEFFIPFFFLSKKTKNRTKIKCKARLFAEFIYKVGETCKGIVGGFCGGVEFFEKATGDFAESEVFGDAEGATFIVVCGVQGAFKVGTCTKIDCVLHRFWQDQYSVFSSTGSSVISSRFWVELPESSFKGYCLIS